jgi:hypothetical protein
MAPALLALALAQADGLPALVERLRSDRVEDRAAASRELEELEGSAAPALRDLLKDADVEVAARARGILEFIRLRRLISGKVRALFPTAVATVTRGDADGRGRLFGGLWRAVREGTLHARDAIPIHLEFVDRGEWTTLEKYDPLRGRSERPWHLGDLAREMLERTLERPGYRSREEWAQWWTVNRDRDEREWYLPDLSGSEMHRAWAVNRLARLGEPELMTRLLEAMGTLQDEAYARVALRGFSGGGHEIVAGLRPYLSDRRWGARLAAAEVLHPYLPTQAIDSIFEAVEHRDRMKEVEWREVIESLEWLAGNIDEARLPRLAGRLTAHPHARASVLRILASRGIVPPISGSARPARGGE